jgi:hypothetical protein
MKQRTRKGETMMSRALIWNVALVAALIAYPWAARRR